MKKIIYLFLALLIVACSSDDSSSDNNEPSNCDVVYLADNGITIKACGDANFGDTGVVNGITSSMLIQNRIIRNREYQNYHNNIYNALIRDI